MNKTKCPFCKGKGYTQVTKNTKVRKYTDAERKKAFKLRQEGYTYRAIGKVLNIQGSSAQKVKNMIDVYCKSLIRKSAYLPPEPEEEKIYRKAEMLFNDFKNQRVNFSGAIEVIQLMVVEAVEEEKNAWLKGLRCELCGKEKEFTELSDCCEECFETM